MNTYDKESNRMHDTTVNQDVYRYILMVKARKIYKELTTSLIGLENVPRESFNRWIFDLHSFADIVTHTQHHHYRSISESEYQRRYHCDDPLFIGYSIENKSEHNMEFILTDLQRRVNKGHPISTLFWELIDDLPKPIVVLSHSHGFLLNEYLRLYLFKNPYFMKLLKFFYVDFLILLKKIKGKLKNDVILLFKQEHSKKLCSYHYKMFKRRIAKNVAHNISKDFIACLVKVNQVVLNTAQTMKTEGYSSSIDSFNASHSPFKDMLNKVDTHFISQWIQNVTTYPLQQNNIESHLEFFRIWISPLRKKRYIQKCFHIIDYRIHVCIPSIIHTLKFLKRRLVAAMIGSVAGYVCYFMEALFLRYNLYFSNKFSYLHNGLTSFQCIPYKEYQAFLCGLCIKGESLICLQSNIKKKLVILNPDTLIDFLDNSYNQDFAKNYLMSVWDISYFSDDKSHIIIKIQLKGVFDLYTKFLKYIHLSDNILLKKKEFLVKLTQLILRYECIHGDAKEGRGHHAAIPKSLWTFLKKQFRVRTECFASPFNYHLKQYYSLFPDIDVYFGSKGSFFHSNTQCLSGSYQMNPPFVQPLINRLLKKIIHSLKLSEEVDSSYQYKNSFKRFPNHKKSLNFIVIVPNWDNHSKSIFIKQLRKGREFCTAKVDVSPYSHMYTYYPIMSEINVVNLFDSNHSSLFLLNSYMIPSLETKTQYSFTSTTSCSLIIFQNRIAKQKYPVTNQVLDAIRYHWKHV